MFILLRKKLDLQPFLCRYYKKKKKRQRNESCCFLPYVLLKYSRLLILLIVFDTVFLITDFMTYSLPMLNDYYHDYIYPKLSPLFLLPLSQVGAKRVDLKSGSATTALLGNNNTALDLSLIF